MIGYRISLLILAVTAMMLVACDQVNSAEAAPDGNASNAQSVQNNGGSGSEFQRGTSDGGNFQPFESAYLDTTYGNSISIPLQLAIGTVQLEETEDAITPEQAASLLPLWQALQSGAIQEVAERNAVFRGVESAMTEDQLQTIAAMELTNDDLREWTEINGIELPEGGQSGQRGPGGALAELSEEERAEIREMNPEERQARFAELGIEVGEGGRGGDRSGSGQVGSRGGQLNAIYQPLIDMLTQRTNE